MQQGAALVPALAFMLMDGLDLRLARHADDQLLERSVIFQPGESRLRLDAVFLQGIQ